MENVLEQLIDMYASELGLLTCNYEMMCKMLDVDFISERIKSLNSSEIYVYGGGYTGIQFYRAVSDMIYIPAIVDKKGKLRLEILDIPVIDSNEFRKKYKGQKVIVTSAKFYNEIKHELLDFVMNDCIIYLGELLGGILQ